MEWFTISRMFACPVRGTEELNVCVQQHTRAGHVVLMEGMPTFRVFVNGGLCSTGVEEFRCTSREVALDFARNECAIYLRDADPDNPH